MVKSAQRVAEALGFLANNPAGALYSDLQRGLDLPKSSLHSLLNTLVETRLAAFDDTSRRYTLGPLVWELAVAFSNQLQLVPLALPHLQNLGNAFGETTQLAILDGSEVVYVAKVPSQHPIQLVSNVGTRLPAYATGIGKALLACLPPDQIDRLYPHVTLTRYTNTTIPTTAELGHELDHIRQRGFATDIGEYSSGIYCVAMPILSPDNVPKAAISISIPQDRYHSYSEAQLVSELSKESYALAAKLGTTDPEHWRKMYQMPVT